MHPPARKSRLGVLECERSSPSNAQKPAPGVIRPTQEGCILPPISQFCPTVDFERFFQPSSPYPGSYRPSLPCHAQNTNQPAPSTLNGETTQASQPQLPDQRTAKKPRLWTKEEDKLVIELRGSYTKWDEIAKRLPGRSHIACRLRYQNYLEKTHFYGDEVRDKLARLYTSQSPKLWHEIGVMVGIPANAAEELHWVLGQQGIKERANKPIPLADSQLVMPSQPQVHPRPSQPKVPTKARKAPKRKAGEMS